MAKLDAKGHLRGVLGPTTTRVVHGVNLIQSKGNKPKQTQNTKKAAHTFGYASRNSKIIRLSICDFIYNKHDRNFFRRLTSATLGLLKKNTAYPLGERTFFNTPMQGLVGFDFNINSPFQSFCTLPLRIQTVASEKVILQFDSFVAQDYLTFPPQASAVQIDFTLLHIPLTTAAGHSSSSYSLYVTPHEVVQADQWEIPLTSPLTFTLIIAELNYVKTVSKDKQISINTCDFHPSCIVYVHNGLG
ncbi:hypothetical protein [Myroides sp. DF42-4-2]|uniref:hypothetical protein n=1 Tax=unclassified Myroides TaxID=2642485 RepID=UPI002578B342|nr:hypothetical protein [Myroides sp. DF42-4-2]MDM1408902.1 hypothetical protein [Myroides sp. DF42-4-2]